MRPDRLCLPMAGLFCLAGYPSGVDIYRFEQQEQGLEWQEILLNLPTRQRLETILIYKTSIASIMKSLQFCYHSH